MSAKQLQQAIKMASNLGKDTAGNILSGNEVRALGYLKALQHTLDAVLEKMNAGNDFRAEKKLEEAIRGICATLDEEHAKVPFDPSRMEETMSKYAKSGYTMTDFAAAMNEEAAKAAGLKVGENTMKLEDFQKLING